MLSFRAVEISIESHIWIWGFSCFGVFCALHLVKKPIDNVKAVYDMELAFICSLFKNVKAYKTNIKRE